MHWIDYAIESFGQQGEGFRIKGDWPGEVMGIDKEGNSKSNWLYKPGDVFVVNESGWLIRQDDLTAMLMKYQAEKNKDD